MTARTDTTFARPRLGVSSCLLGDRVRYDGDHKRLDLLAGAMSRHVDWVRVCPELEVGMGVPREPVRLLRNGGGTRMVGVESGRDWTGSMSSWARDRLARLPPLDGFILKARSPSCGPRSVAIEGGEGDTGAGLWAQALSSCFPGLPLIDEGGLSDSAQRHLFLDTAYARAGWREFMAFPVQRRVLLEFHDRHHPHLRARDPVRGAELTDLAHRTPVPAPEAALRLYAESFHSLLSLPVAALPEEAGAQLYPRELSMTRGEPR